jgi:ribokinase
MLEPEGERTIVTIGERLEPLGSDELPWGLVHGAAGVYFTAGDAAALKHAREAGFVVASPRGRSALEGTRPRIDALVFSSRDPAESEWARRVEKWARVLVATDGPRGGTWWGESQGSWDAVEPPAEPRDSYGCGDYFAAGFTFGLASGMPVEEAVRVGARWGAVALTRGGAP